MSPAGNLNDNKAVVQAEINGFKFLCRINSGADKESISDTIVNFLGEKRYFIPNRPLSNPIGLKPFDGRPVKSLDMAQIPRLIQTIGGPCRLQNTNVYFTEYTETFVRSDNDCTDKMFLVTHF